MGLALADIDGKYEIVAKLREGGMGAIYKVRHRLLGEIRIVKVLRPQHEDDAELRERFAREARSAIRLRHPNVVHLFDFSVDDQGAGLIVMEFISGADLHRLIQQKRLPSVSLALEIARQGLRALGFLHQHGFVHRDVSPDNLMLSLDFDRRPLVKLIDLGIAKSTEAEQKLTVSGSFLGKFRYASPEHFGAKGPDGVEPRSDLYTFGLVFYELLTGQYPMPGGSTSQLIASHLFQPPHGFLDTDPDARIPQPVREMVLKSLAKSPSGRWANAGEWIEAIEVLQVEHPVTRETIKEARELVDNVSALTSPPPVPGSTQHRLDQHFGLETTPRPETLRSVSAASSGRRGDAVDQGDAQIAALLAGAEALFHLGQQEQARQQVQTLLRLRPDLPAAERLLERIDQGQSAAPGAPGTVASANDQAPAVPPPIPTKIIEPASDDWHASSTDRSLLLGLERVEKLLAEDQLTSADELVSQLLEEHGERRRLLPLKARVDQARHDELATEVRRHLAAADDLVEAGDYPQALEILRRAQETAPEDGPLHVELTQGVQRLNEKVQEREQRRAVEQIERHVLQLLDEAKIHDAKSELERARSAYGDDELASLQREVDEATQAQLSHLAHQAGQALEAEDYDVAIDFLERVVELDPQSRWLREQLEKARSLRDEKEARRRLKRQLEAKRQRLAQAVRESGEAGDFDRASELLEELAGSTAAEGGDAAEGVADDDDAGRLSALVDELRGELDASRQQRMRKLLDQARQAQDAEDWFKARLLVARARQLAPSDPEVAALSQQLHEAATRATDSPLPIDGSAGLLVTIAEIERLKVDGEGFRAWKEVQQAIERFGELDALVELRRELADQMLDL